LREQAVASIATDRIERERMIRLRIFYPVSVKDSSTRRL
jgi:hypothetical protein